MDLEAVDLVANEICNMFPEYSDKNQITNSLMLFANYIDKDTDDHTALMLFVCMLRAAKEHKLNNTDTTEVLNFINGKSANSIAAHEYEGIKNLQKELWRIASLESVKDYMKYFSKSQRTSNEQAAYNKGYNMTRGCFGVIILVLIITSLFFI